MQITCGVHHFLPLFSRCPSEICTESTGFVIQHQTSQYCNYWVLAGIITACVNLSPQTRTHVAPKKKSLSVCRMPQQEFQMFGFGDPVWSGPKVHTPTEADSTLSHCTKNTLIQRCPPLDRIRTVTHARPMESQACHSKDCLMFKSGCRDLQVLALKHP